MYRIGYVIGVAVLAAAVAVLHFPSNRSNAFPLPKPGESAKPAVLKATPLHEYITMLNEEVDITILQGGEIRLRNVVEFLSSKTNTRGKELPIVVDHQNFRMENPDAPDILETHVSFPLAVKKMTRAAVLRHALSHAPTDNATFIVRSDGIRITTLSMSATPQLLREKVLAVYDQRPLKEVLAELSQKVGVSLVIDPRAGDKMKMPVTATFNNDVSMGAAFILLADMADLKCLIRPNSLYVTTRDHAETLEKEETKEAERMLKLLQQGQVPNMIPGGVFVGQPNPGGFGIGGIPPGGLGFTGFHQFDRSRWRQQPGAGLSGIPGLGI